MRTSCLDSLTPAGRLSISARGSRTSRVAQQGVGLGGFLATRTGEIRLVKVDGVDLIKADEAVNVQRPGPARRDGIGLVLVQHHVVPPADIGSLDNVGVPYFLSGALVDPLVADAVGGALLELV